MCVGQRRYSFHDCSTWENKTVCLNKHLMCSITNINSFFPFSFRHTKIKRLIYKRKHWKILKSPQFGLLSKWLIILKKFKDFKHIIHILCPERRSYRQKCIIIIILIIIIIIIIKFICRWSHFEGNLGSNNINKWFDRASKFSIYIWLVFLKFCHKIKENLYVMIILIGYALCTLSLCWDMENGPTFKWLFWMLWSQNNTQKCSNCSGCYIWTFLLRLGTEFANTAARSRGDLSAITWIIWMEWI